MLVKSERVHLVATKAQLARWRLCADERGVSLSEFMRQSAERAVAFPLDERARRLGELHIASRAADE